MAFCVVSKWLLGCSLRFLASIAFFKLHDLRYISITEKKQLFCCKYKIYFRYIFILCSSKTNKNVILSIIEYYI